MLPYLVSNKRIIHKLIGFRVQGLIQSRDLWRHSCHTWTTSNVVDAEVLPWNRSVLDDKQKYFCFRWVVTSGVKYQLIGPLTLADCCKSLRILKQIGEDTSNIKHNRIGAIICSMPIDTYYCIITHTQMKFVSRFSRIISLMKTQIINCSWIHQLTKFLFRVSLLIWSQIRGV